MSTQDANDPRGADAYEDDDPYDAPDRRAGPNVPLMRGSWRGVVWVCPQELPTRAPCPYRERGLSDRSYGDGVCPEHGVPLRPATEDPAGRR